MNAPYARRAFAHHRCSEHSRVQNPATVNFRNRQTHDRKLTGAERGESQELPHSGSEEENARAVLAALIINRKRKAQHSFAKSMALITLRESVDQKHQATTEQQRQKQSRDFLGETERDRLRGTVQNFSRDTFSTAAAAILSAAVVVVNVQVHIRTMFLEYSRRRSFI